MSNIFSSVILVISPGQGHMPAAGIIARFSKEIDTWLPAEISRTTQSALRSSGTDVRR